MLPGKRFWFFPHPSRWLTWLVLVSIFLLGIVCLPGIVRHHRSLAQQATLATAQMQDALTVQLTSRTWTLQRLAQQWHHDGRPSQHSWTDDVAAYLKAQAGYEMLAWVDASQQLQWHVSLENPPAQAFSSQLLKTIKERGKVTVVAPFGPKQQRLLLATPVDTQETFDGWLVGVMQLPVVLDSWLTPFLPSGYGMTVFAGRAVAYHIPPTGTFPTGLLTPAAPLEIAGSTWKVEIQPPVVIRSLINVSEVDVLQGGGLCLAILLAWIMRQRRRNHAATSPKACQTSRADGTPALSPLLTRPPLMTAQPDVALYCMDHQGLLTYVSPQAALLLGWRPEEVLRKPQHVLLHHTLPNGRVYPRDACPIDLALRDGVPHQVAQDLFWRRNGTRFPATYTCTPVRDTQDQVIGITVVFQRLPEPDAAASDIPAATASNAVQ